ncbi:MAG: EAL domain-containing protein (putative c-di-GMP-specific phosphodiesterase class I) [Janthinobacterium sp.]|jgi:EAL domain-containing protein (putative c-di-GMP-specific phosphodiesterase class I)
MEIGQLHFLVADGDPVLRHSLADMLTRLGAGKVSVVANGHAALRSFDVDMAPAIDVAIIDLSLPGLDGLDVLRHLADARCLAGIIVIGAQRNDVLFSVKTIAHAYGVDLLGEIAKPVAQQDLAVLIERYLAPAVPARAPGPAFTFEEIEQGLQEHQFEPFFQPMIELETGQIKGLETFARWRHPQHGMLDPVDFMAPLQQRGRVDFLDWGMIESALAGCRVLHDQGMPMSISINLAPYTLVQAGFMAQLSACLAQHRIMAQYITFELPESAVLSTDAQFLERLLRLRMLGFGLAIDDYGAGCTNLQALARMPFSELKIDRNFVDGASKAPALATVLRTCLGLARSLERRSVAVGVEVEADWDFLQGMGCTCAQGYYIGKPMALAEFPVWLKDWRQFF